MNERKETMIAIQCLSIKASALTAKFIVAKDSSHVVHRTGKLLFVINAANRKRSIVLRDRCYICKGLEQRFRGGGGHDLLEVVGYY